MIKPLLLCATLLLMAGCTSVTKPATSDVKARPHGLIKMLEDETGGTYADMRTVSLYQGNPQLRRLWLINNYEKGGLYQKNPPISVYSSRAIYVFNCETHEYAQFERIYFTQRWAEGDKVFKRHSVGQWQPYPQESLMGIIAAAVCLIEPARLKPEPPRDTDTPDVGD